MTTVVLCCAIGLQLVGQSADEGTAPTQHWYASPEWWLVGVGILTLLAIAYQSRETAIAAKAAATSADTLINIYRPWLLFETADPFDLRSYLVSQQGQVGTVQITLKFKNYGQTPAWVSETSCKFINISGPSIPESLDFGPSTKLPNPHDVPPQHPFEIVVDPAPSLRVTEMDEIADAKRTLCVFGYLKYQVFPEKQATTHFCLRYSLRRKPPFIESEGWQYAGSVGANKHT